MGRSEVTEQKPRNYPDIGKLCSNKWKTSEIVFNQTASKWMPKLNWYRRGSSDKSSPSMEYSYIHLMQSKQETGRRTRSDLSQCKVGRFAKVAFLSDSIAKLPPGARIAEGEGE